MGGIDEEHRFRQPQHQVPPAFEVEQVIADVHEGDHAEGEEDQAEQLVVGLVVIAEIGRDQQEDGRQDRRRNLDPAADEDEVVPAYADPGSEAEERESREQEERGSIGSEIEHQQDGQRGPGPFLRGIIENRGEQRHHNQVPEIP